MPFLWFASVLRNLFIIVWRVRFRPSWMRSESVNYCEINSCAKESENSTTGGMKQQAVTAVF